MFGDAGTDNTDASYGGETGESLFSLQYYRNKANEFQAVLNQVDQVAQAAQRIIDASPNSDIAADLYDKISEFDLRRVTFRVTAEAINAGAALVNSAGGRFPQLSIPSGLGLAPLALPATTIAAIGVAAALVSWGLAWIVDVKGIITRYMTLSAIEDPQLRAIAATELEKIGLAERAAMNPLSDVAGVVKWVAVAAVAFFAWRAFSQSKYAQNPMLQSVSDDDIDDEE